MSRRTRFLTAIAVGALTLVLLSAISGVRSTLHTGVVVVGAVALMPALVIAVVFGVFIVAGIVAGLVGADVDDMDLPSLGQADVDPRWIGRYYRFLFRQRSPWLVGGALGVVVAVVGLAVFLALWIVPREAETAQTLASLHVHLEAARKKDGRLPPPSPEGHLRLPEEASSAVDAFERPLRYEVRGGRLLASYRLISLGYDGALGSGDDLCVDGGTRLGDLLSTIGTFTEKVERLRSGTLPDASEFQLVRQLRCASSSEL